MEETPTHHLDQSETVTPPRFDLSPTLSDIRDRFLKEERPVAAAVIAEEILKRHPDYLRGRAAAALPLEASPTERPVEEWLREIGWLFDPALAPTLHGRLAVIGLCLLEPNLRRQLEKEGVFNGLIGELAEPYKEILTEQGRFADRSSDSRMDDSVPTQPDDPLLRIEEDQLGRSAFARFLARRIAAVPEDAGAYAIHVYGPWGSGKTTLRNFLRQELEDAYGWNVADFNAWRNQHVRPPWWSLLESVFESAKPHLSPWNRLREYGWRFNTGRLHYILGLIILVWALALILFPILRETAGDAGSLGFWAGIADQISKILAVILTVWGVVYSASRSLLLNSAKAARTYMEMTHDPMNMIKRRFQRLVRRLRGKRMAVFIDDLDRCQSGYVIELLEGIQTLFREAPVVFVVTADRRWLNACYEETYEKLKPFVSEPGKPLGILFLEKAFQFATPAPGIPREIKETFWKRLILVKTEDTDLTFKEAREKAGGALKAAKTDAAINRKVEESQNLPFHEQRAVREEAVIRLAAPDILARLEHTLTPYVGLLEPNPRSMKRLVNTYSANRALAILSEVDIDTHQLVLWTILASRWPQLADYLAKCPEMVEKIIQKDAAGVEEGLADLVNDDAVRHVLQGGAADVPLHPKTIRDCARMHV